MSQNTSTLTVDTYEIGVSNGTYIILMNGEPLTDRNSRTRFFASRNSARKTISRIRRGVTN